MPELRGLVLSSFKKLHRTRIRVFDGDLRALTAAREKINEEFKKNKHVSDEGAIKEMVQFSNEVEKELRTSVIQAQQVKPGVYEARITKDTLKLDNVPFNENAILDDGAPGPKPCCQNPPQPKANKDGIM